MFILQYKMSATVTDLVVVFALFCIYACTAVFLCCCRLSMNKDLYKPQTVPEMGDFRNADVPGAGDKCPVTGGDRFVLGLSGDTRTCENMRENTRT